MTTAPPVHTPNDTSPSLEPPPGAAPENTAPEDPESTAPEDRAPAINPAIPGPEPMPILGWRGNLLRHFRNPIRSMREMRERHGDVVCLAKGGNQPLIMVPPGGPTSTVFAFGPVSNKAVLGQPNVFESDKVRAPKQCPWLGDNMVAANRRDRARQRRTLIPAFAGDHLRAYYGDIVSLTEKMLATWRVDEKINLTDEVEELTAGIASQTFYGQKLENHPGALAEIAREAVQLAFSPLSKIPIDLPGTPYHKMVRLAAKAEKTVLEEIERRRELGLEGDDVLTIMLRSIEEGNVELPQNHLVGNAFTLFLAGHDVPANALGFIFLLLAQHPEVAAELDAELEAELGGGPPTWDQIFKLPVLDRVVKETLRVLVPAIVVWRRLTSPAELAGYEVPVGTEVLVSPYMTHIDPEVYPEPLRFRPERWEGLKPTPFEYLPFSYGARKCLGAAFAEAMLRIVTAMVVQRYRLELIPKTRVDMAVTMTMKPKGGLPVIVRPRDREFQRSRAPLEGYVNEMVDFPS